LRVPGDHEDGVDTAVTAPVGIELEPGLADGTVALDEGRDVVEDVEPELLNDAEQRVDRRAGAAGGRLDVTSPAPHEVEARAEALVDLLLRRKVRQTLREHPLLGGGQAGNRAAGAGAPTADPRIMGAELGGQPLGRAKNYEGDHDTDEDPGSHLSNLPGG